LVWNGRDEESVLDVGCGIADVIFMFVLSALASEGCCDVLPSRIAGIISTRKAVSFQFSAVSQKDSRSEELGVRNEKRQAWPKVGD
jgi:hypothetical protein